MEYSDALEEYGISSEEEVPDFTSPIKGLLGSLLEPEAKLTSDPPLARATRGSAGYDLTAEVQVDIQPETNALVLTKQKFTVDENYYVQLYTRSSTALHGAVKTATGIKYSAHGVSVEAGVIDSDYKLFTGVVMRNHSKDRIFSVRPGDKIAQAIIHKIHFFDNELPPLKGDEFEHTGFGSTN